MLLTIACMLQAVINETGTLPVILQKIQDERSDVAEAGNKGEQSQPALTGVYQRIMGSDCKYHTKSTAKISATLNSSGLLPSSSSSTVSDMAGRFHRQNAGTTPSRQQRQTLSANTDKWLSKPLH